MIARALIVVLTLVVAAPALAAPVSDVKTVPTTESTSPWRGSSIDWAHTSPLTTFNKAASLSYDPTYVQSLYLLPQWHFTPWLFASGRMALDLELTNSDSSTNFHEIVVSDAVIDVATSGWEEPLSKIKVSGGLRTVLPVSLSSQAASLRLAMGPGVNLGRSFDVLGGLNVGLSGRFTGLATATDVGHKQSSPIACGDRNDDTCVLLLYDAVANTWGSLSGGPNLSLAIGPVTFLGDLQFIRTFTHGLPTSVSVQPLTGPVTFGSTSSFPRDYSRFLLGASWQFTKELSVGLTGISYSPEFAPDGARYSPFYNRYTVASLDLGLDVEALVSRFSR